MTKRTFPYTYFEVPPGLAFPQGCRAARPILQVVLTSGDRRISCYAIIDSGADHCVFPKSFLRQLGIDADALSYERAGGVGGSALSHFREITLAVPSLFEHSVFAGFTEGLDLWSVGLLGQSGFFDRMKVSLDLPHGTFEIET